VPGGIECENNASFSLTRSKSTTINKVNYDEFGDNSIEIIASGDGSFQIFY